VGSAVTGAKAAKSQAAVQQQALDKATTTINPFQVNGFGGMGAGYGMPAPGAQPGQQGGTPNAGQMDYVNPQTFPTMGFDMGGYGGGYGGYNFGGYGGGFGMQPQQPGVAGNSINLSAGDLEGARSALSQFATQGVPGAGQGIPYGVQQAMWGLQGASRQLPGTNLGGINALNQSGWGQFGQAQNQLDTAYGGFQPNLQSTAFRGAATQFQDASMGGQDVYNRTLDQLRQQAQPFETRAYDQLQNDQFSRGQMGTTGGGIQTEAFARGLGQADLSRQLQATQSGQQFQQNALGIGQGLAGVGQGLAGQGDQLLQSAFGRYGQLSQQLAGYNDTGYQRNAAQNMTQYGRAQDMLGAQTGISGLPYQLQGAQLQNVLAALQGQSGIQQQGLQLFGAGLSAEQAAANARIGSGSNLGNIVTNPNFGGAGYGTSAALGQLAQSFSPAGGSLAAISSLFKPAAPAYPTSQVSPTGGL
jgi:hypothetical protein